MNFKRFLKMILFLLFLLVISIPPVFANEVTITSDNLNVRSSPTTESEIIIKVHTGDTYQMLQTINEWIEIQLPQQTGWVHSDYVSVNQQITEDTPEEKIEQPSIMEEKDHKIIIQNKLYMRSNPSTNSPITAFIDKGSKITINKENDLWYKIDFNNDVGYIHHNFIKTNFNKTNLYNRKIVIDAGHGGLDVGSISQSGLYEKDFALTTTKKLQEKLTSLGAEVILTRENDNYIRLGSRATFTNIANADAFISIHYNSFPENPAVSGINTYYYRDKHQGFADSIQDHLIKQTDAIDRDVLFGDFLVLRQNNLPAVLVELGFISNQANEQLILTNSYQEKLVNGLINGFSEYFQQIN